jgi:hypothetical protein
MLMMADWQDDKRPRQTSGDSAKKNLCHSERGRIAREPALSEVEGNLLFPAHEYSLVRHIELKK